MISWLPLRKCRKPGFWLFLSSPHPSSKPAVPTLRLLLPMYGAPLVTQMVKNLPAAQTARVRSPKITKNQRQLCENATIPKKPRQFRKQKLHIKIENKEKNESG